MENTKEIKAELVVTPSAKNDNKRDRSNCNVDAKVKKLESTLEDHYHALTKKFDSLNEKFEVLKKNTQKYEFKINHYYKFVQDFIQKQNKDASSIRTKLYELKFMNNNTFIIAIEVILIIGALHGFAKIVFSIISTLLALIF